MLEKGQSKSQSKGQKLDGQGLNRQSAGEGGCEPFFRILAVKEEKAKASNLKSKQG